MKSMMKLAAVLLSTGVTPALAQDFPGAIIAAYYMEQMSIPKGWRLAYKGKEGGVQIFIMDRDLDASPQTGFLRPVDQMRRLMCGDASLKAMMAAGTRVRADARDKLGGKVAVTRGEVLDRC